MKKLSLLLIMFVFLLQAGTALADKEQAIFAIQKAKSFIEKVKAKNEDMKAPADALRSAKDYLDQAEAVLKRNTSMLGKLKKEAEPDIVYYSEMAEISATMVLSRLDKINQEKENARLEKLIPDIEAKIKVFKDKDAEIQRLTEELKKPRGSMQTLNGEITLLKKEKTDLAEQASRLKLEKENLSGKLEALSGVLTSTKKDLSEKSKEVEGLKAENQRLKALELYKAMGKLDYMTKMSEKGSTFIVPRKDMIKTTSKGPALAPDAERCVAKFVDLTQTFPESKLTIVVHGFGNPGKSEDKKATEAMALLLKQAFLKNGIKESSIETTGAGSGSPLFSKGAVEENRRVEITVSR